MNLKIKNIACVLLLTIFFNTETNYGQNTEGLIVLKNHTIEVGVLPEVGGRVVLLRLPGYENVFRSNPDLWIDANKKKPEVNAYADFMEFDGHIVWNGPQSEWWIYQDLNPNLKKIKSNWPPDPFTIYSEYKVLEKTDSSLKIVSPKSPVTGLILTKTISISSRGQVTFNVVAENARDEDVSWDLWMNTRLNGYAKCYVPVRSEDDISSEMRNDERIIATPYKTIKNLFTYTPYSLEDVQKEQEQKVLITPSGNWIVGFDNQQMLVIEFEKLESELIHPENGPVEVYHNIKNKGEYQLLELEVHGRYQTLKPSKTMSMTETWNVVPYNGNNTESEQIEFISNYWMSRDK